ERIELEIGDIRTMSVATLDGVAAVVNVAGLSNDPSAEFNPRANYEMNTLAAQKLARLCQQAGVRRYLFASTCSIYDVGAGNETEDVVFDEDAPVAPTAAYSCSKYEAERILLGMNGK